MLCRKRMLSFYVCEQVKVGAMSEENMGRSDN
jgi:hypothetical protein